MNRSQPNNRRSFFGRANNRRLQERLPVTGFGGDRNRPSSIAVCPPRNSSSAPSYLEDNSSGDFGRCAPRAPCVRDPLMAPSRAGGDSLQGPSSNAPPRAFVGGPREQVASGGTFQKELEVREDYSHSALRRARMNQQRNDDDYYYGQDSIIEAMPSTLPPSLYDGFTSSGAASRRNRGAVYPYQRDAMMEPMSRNSLPLKSAPPSCYSMESYEEVVSRKMAAYDPPMAQKKTPVLPAPSATPAPATSAFTNNVIEISPGVTARLRGAQETMNCIAHDFYVPTTCYCCSTNLFCIMDADYVLCPVCKVVSPVGDNDNQDSSYEGGVGLGFTFEDLQHYQEEILSGRSRA